MSSPRVAPRSRETSRAGETAVAECLEGVVQRTAEYNGRNAERSVEVEDSAATRISQDDSRDAVDSLRTAILSGR